MFTYNEIEKSCKRLGIDTQKRGKNISAVTRLIYAKIEPADVKKLSIPKRERTQVEKIGQIINNLSSQLKFPLFFDLTNEEGKLEKEMHDKITTFLPIANQSQINWFVIGVKKSSLIISDFSVYNGLVYHIDKEKIKATDEINNGWPSKKGFHRSRPDRRPCK